MNWKKCMLPTLVVSLMVAFFGYMVVSIFIVPIKANCPQVDYIPPDAAVGISMGDWIFGNMLSGVILFSIMGSLCKESKGSSGCLVAFTIFLASLYYLFQIAWIIIGFMIFSQTYEQVCSQADSFNTLVRAELYYGAALFLAIGSMAIGTIVTVVREERVEKEVGVQERLVSEEVVVGVEQKASGEAMEGKTNVYRQIYYRISGSFEGPAAPGVN